MDLQLAGKRALGPLERDPAPLVADMLSDKTVKRLGTVEEVADLVAFVASPRAGYINGANLRIDGGKSPSVN